MSTKRRNSETITALLSSAPAIVPDRDRVSPQGREQPKVAELVRPAGVLDVPDDDLDDSDLEAFELAAEAPLVKPRRRRQVEYQTVRINRPTAKILRAQWLLARQQDPLLSYTEFSTIAVQSGLRALKEQRERGE
jgi:hypothetical protein